MIREKESFDSSRSLGGIKPLSIRLHLITGEAQPVPPLSATLGQIRVNASDFCRNFNAISLETYEPGVLVNVKLYKNTDDTYYFKINGVSKPFLFFQSCDSDKFIPLEILYDIFISSNFTPVSNKYSKAKEYFGSLRSMKFKVLF